MDTDNRKHPRFCPDGLTASISISPPPPSEKIALEGAIINMSYTGIKIKLNSPIKDELADSLVTITLTLPESGIPILIHGSIKHFNDDSEYGVHYSQEHHSEQEVDDLMFECIKRTDKPLHHETGLTNSDLL